MILGDVLGTIRRDLVVYSLTRLKKLFCILLYCGRSSTCQMQYSGNLRLVLVARVSCSIVHVQLAFLDNLKKMQKSCLILEARLIVGCITPFGKND